MRVFLLGILVLLQLDIYAFGSDVQTLNGDIRNFAVGLDKIYVVTDSQLLQLHLNLSVDKYMDISNDTHPNRVNILLPFPANKTLIVCGTLQCGYCEVLDINDITKSIYREKTGISPFENESSVAFLLEYDEDATRKGTFMLVGRENEERIKQKNKDKKDYDFTSGVNIWNTLYSQYGDIFSKSGIDPTGASINSKEHIQWVDGFQTSSSSHSYLFANIKSESEPKVVMLRMDNKKSKTEMIKSLKGATLECCDDKPRRKLLSSAVISSSSSSSSSSSLLWTGIFSVQNPHDPENTALAIYNFSSLKDGVPSDFSCEPRCNVEKVDQNLSEQSVVFKHNSMTSVATETKESWTVLYIGTAHGQLMKLVLDKALRAGCITVLHRTDEDRMVLSKMHFSPMDHKHIFIASGNEIRRVALSQCGTFKTLRECTASMDSSCGWCVTTAKCSTQDECSYSTWISIPEDVFRKELISFQVAHNSEVVTLNLRLDLKVTGSPLLRCTFKAGSVDVCDKSGPATVFPNCSCSFSSKHLPFDGLEVAMNVHIGNQILTKSLKLRNCTDITEISPYAQCAACISAGCSWSQTKQCNWTQESVAHPRMQDVCKALSHGQNYTPEIVSLWPNHVSIHGVNNAVIKGKHLGSVIKIRFQGIMDCNPQEISVLERTNDSLKFNIPSRHEETVKVCVVMADGRCHGNTVMTYGPPPTCTGLQPRISWASGGRKIQVLGTSLKYVEAITMHPPIREMSVKSSLVGLWFHTLPLWVFNSYGPFTVSLRVGNSTVDCADKLSYSLDPIFIKFFTSNDFNDMFLIIQKNEDRLNMSNEDVQVWGLQNKKQFNCVIEKIMSTVLICKIPESHEVTINVDSVRISVGDFSIVLENEANMFCMRTLP